MFYFTLFKEKVKTVRINYCATQPRFSHTINVTTYGGVAVSNFCVNVLNCNTAIHYTVVHVIKLAALYSNLWRTGYASQHIWCLSQAKIKWEGCGRKGIQHKNGGMTEVGR